ncbi:hypothetical protein [Nocardioides acrostichi]|uniref:Lipopolysaccharide assembly protein A domain-containing protein n=1 Tax=Nocardioides acrostichi TaxID=2784339 RepID=A0A930V053_9ACTN|nr:hypothetical protein [Nocardioides acrostichi]MBF4163256.1 hypothetical protein [Nocardioides acrostichi]
MVVLGIILIALGAVLVLACVFTAKVVGTHVEVLGIGFSPLVVFAMGVLATLLVIVGWGLMKYGTRRALRARRERKKLGELSEKLDAVEAERRREGDDADAH